MTDALRQRYREVRDWFERARAGGWLAPGDVQGLERVERGTPEDLFDPGGARPLVVALFGGTGVGKSSLLNRLAGEPIARTGLERPTSLEVTAYLHESVALAQLPEELPMARLRVARHHNEGQRGLMWLDMPDIDSTEVANRSLSLAWLAHVDLLVYVVSPERYRDDAGWRVLLERRERHGWLFVMNHWDQGTEPQIADFAGILQGAGFAEPVVLRTCCMPPDCVGRDELPRLLETLDALQAAHGQRELERLGHIARLRDLRAALLAAAGHLGTEEQWTEVRKRFLAGLEQVEAEILEGMRWPIRDLAARLAPSSRSWVGRLLQATAVPEAIAGDPALDGRRGSDDIAAALQDRLADTIWDAWAQRKLDEAIDALEVTMQRGRVSADPLVEPLRAQACDADALVVQQAAEVLRRALARPGGRGRRLLLGVTGLARWLLPAVALAWISIHVLQGFYRGVTAQGAFLGVDFAVNAGLLLLVAWLLPALLHRMLRPSLEVAAQRALQSGLQEGLGRLGGRFVASLDRVGDERARLAREVEQLQAMLIPDNVASRPLNAAVIRLVSRTPDQDQDAAAVGRGPGAFKGSTR